MDDSKRYDQSTKFSYKGKVYDNEPSMMDRVKNPLRPPMIAPRLRRSDEHALITPKRVWDNVRYAKSAGEWQEARHS